MPNIFSFGNFVTGCVLLPLLILPAVVQANEDATACIVPTGAESGLPPHGICPTSLTPSGPIKVESDNATIENLDINSTSHEECGIFISKRKNVTIKNVNINHAGAGICVFNSKNITIESVRLVNTIKVAGPHCRPGLTVQECKESSRKSEPENVYKANTHNNIWIKKSKNVAIKTAYMEKGESGIFAHKTSDLNIENIYCRDIRGPYWRGQCVMVTKSHGANISRFYTRQFLETSSGHDNISAFESNDVVVSDGLVDGNWSRNGVGVIADKGAHNMTVKDVDITHAGTAGVNVWSGAKHGDTGTIGDNFTVENVRVRDGHCDGTWYFRKDLGPSSGGRAFAMHPLATGARFINSQYWNHCRPGAVFTKGDPAIKDIVEEEFEIKAPPIEISFPWVIH